MLYNSLEMKENVIESSSLSSGFEKILPGSPELLFQSVWENSANGMRLTDENGIIINVNDAFCKLVEIPKAELIGVDFANVYHMSLRDQIKRQYANRFKTHTVDTRFERRLRLSSGKEIDVEVTNSFIEFKDDKPLLLSIIRDISARKRAEEALRESEERYHRITVAVTDYIFTVFIENGNVVKTVHGPACIAVTGYATEEFAADPYLWITMVVPEDHDHVEKHASSVLTDKDPDAIEHRIRRKDGAVRWVLNTPVPHRDSSGTLISYDGLISDITERKLAETALKESEERYRAVVDTATDAIITIDMKGRIIFGNTAASALFGYSAEEMLGQPLSMLMPEKYRREHDLGLARVVSGGESHVIGKTIEVLGLRKDGSEFPMELSLARWQTGNDMFFTGIIRDITEHKLLEEKIIEAQKMDSIGNLAGGVAHDFNNMLASIMGYSSLLLMNETDVKRKKYLESIVKSSERASKLTQQLLAFGRKGKNLNQAININTIADEVYKMIERTISKEIILEKRLAEDIYTIDGDPSQITHVIMNLCVNAKEAIPDSGTIIVETGNITIDNTTAKRYPNVHPGEYVVLSISDSGSGISEEVRKQLFEPFFTTKKDGNIKGTGLGLAVVYGIVHAHKGFIDLETEVGKGTTFYVYFPRGEKKYVQEKVVEQQIVQGRGTILVVEDEEAIRDLVDSALPILGYSVILAKDGEEGVDIYRERHSEIDAVVLDMQMPKMGGKEAFKRMKSINPDIRAVLCTGFGKNEQAQEILDLGVKILLPKPYNIKDLSRVITEILTK